MYPKRQKFIACFFGMSPESYGKCSEDTRGKIASTFITMIILHSITAFTIGLGMGWGFFRDYRIVLSISLIVLIFLISIDRILVTAQRHWTLVGARLLLLFALPLLHVAFFDLIFFESDIQGALREKNQAAVGVIREHYANLEKRHHLEIDQIDQNIRNERDSIVTWQKMNIGELNGTLGSRQRGKGDIYQAQQEHLSPLIEQSLDQIAKLEKSRVKLANKIAIIPEQVRQDISSLPKWAETGLLERLYLLKEKAWSPEGYFIQALSLAWIAIFLFIDGIMLLPAVTAPFSEYRERVDREKRVADNIQILELQQLENFKIIELKAIFEEKILSMQAAYKWSTFRAEASEITKKLNFELELIERLEKEEKNLEQRFAKAYQKMARVAYLRALDELFELFNSGEGGGNSRSDTWKKSA